jgi:hypothetical protein
MPCVHVQGERKIIQERVVIQALQAAIPGYIQMLTAIEVTPPFIFALSYLGMQRGDLPHFSRSAELLSRPSANHD